MAFKDYYKILGLSKNATQKEIKNAYRQMARKYHPDLNPNDKIAEKQFKDINEANEVLSSPGNRKKYDEYGEHWKYAEEYQKAEQQENYQKSTKDQFGGYSEEDFSDFFNSMFGKSSSKTHSRQVKFKGQDYNAELQLNIKDVYKTHKRTISINNKNIRITIPAGVQDSQIIKIKGYGGKGINNGPNGDLYIQFAIINQTNFRRVGDNLYANVDLDLYKALLGGEVIVNTFEGKAKLLVKPESKNGTIIKLKGKGFPIYKGEGNFGDLYLTYNIKTPTNLNLKEKELFKELEKLRKL